MPAILCRGLRTKLYAGQALTPESERLLANPSWEKASARILIVRLSPFRDVDRSASHLVLFAELRRANPALYLDFAFFPSRAERQILRAAETACRAPQTAHGADAGTAGAAAAEAGSTGADAGAAGTAAEAGAAKKYSWYYGIASGRPPADYDLLLVSNSFGLELINLPYLFSTSDMPPRARERRRKGGFPLVLAGGSNASAAGPLVFEDGDSFVDGIFFGEAEGGFVPLISILLDTAYAPDERLRRAISIPGFWAPGLSAVSSESTLPAVGRRLCPGSPPPLTDQPLLNSKESSTARIQISAGCPGLCSFCFEGWDRKPYRELPLGQVIDCARAIKRRTGADTLEVFSFNFNTHADVFALFFELGRIFRRVSFMSQRLDILAETPLLFEAELAGEKRSYTLGVEGVSARMRAFYRKGLTEEDITAIIGKLVSPEVREIKLFYIISGLETDADIAEFAEFMAGLSRLKAERAPGLRVLASAGYLVRIPRTPLEYAPLALDKTTLEDRAERLARGAAGAGIEFRVASRFDEYCADQILSLRGEVLAPWLEKVTTHNFVYDGALDRGVWESMESYLSGRGLLGPAFTGEKPETYRPPLSALPQDPGLYHEYLEARAGRDKRMHLEKHIRPGTQDDIARIRRLRAAKAAFQPVSIEAEIPDELEGATDSYRNAWITRKLLEALPGGESQIFETREVLFSSGEICGLPEGWTGRSVFEVYGPSAGTICEAARGAGFSPLPAGCKPPGIIALQVLLPAALGLDGFRAFLAGMSLACIEVRDREQDARIFQIAAKDIKKGLVLSARATQDASQGDDGARRGGILLELSLGAKIRIAPWIRAEQGRVLDCPSPLVRVRSFR